MAALLDSRTFTFCTFAPCSCWFWSSCGHMAQRTSALALDPPHGSVRPPGGPRWEGGPPVLSWVPGVSQLEAHTGQTLCFCSQQPPLLTKPQALPQMAAAAANKHRAETWESDSVWPLLAVTSAGAARRLMKAGFHKLLNKSAFSVCEAALMSSSCLWSGHSVSPWARTL